AQINDLLPLHSGKIFHIGGDDAFLLGSNPATRKRAEELGGLEAVYLDHIGAVSRYLASQSFQPLIWDEMLREMTDEQIKWLTPDAALLFLLHEPLTPELVPDIISHLERYKILRRSAWGATMLSPNAPTLQFMEAWSALQEFQRLAAEVESELRGNFIHIQNGTADSLQAGLLRWKVQELKSRAPDLIAHFTQAAERISTELAVQEY